MDQFKSADQILEHLLTPFRPQIERGGCFSDFKKKVPILNLDGVKIAVKGKILYIFSSNTTLLHYLRNREPEIWEGIRALHRERGECRTYLNPTKILFKFSDFSSGMDPY
jgi:hypothetical protein